MIVSESDGLARILAPAKLNLFLEILGRRPDGYHELETLMVAVDLYDTLTFADDPSGQIVLTCDDPGLPAGRDNLVVKAAELLKEASGCSRGASITLEKQIPVRAGLGGGSSDAAAALVGLDRLWGLQTPGAELDALAGALGSDVAFFLHGPAAVGRGRGERVESVGLDRRLDFVLVIPPIGVSTADVYQNLEREQTPPERPRPIGPVLEALAHGGPADLGGCLYNRLQPTAERLRPELSRVRDALAELCPSPLGGCLMSGSGSAYFGLACDRNAAEDAAGRLLALGLGQVRVVTAAR